MLVSVSRHLHHFVISSESWLSSKTWVSFGKFWTKITFRTGSKKSHGIIQYFSKYLRWATFWKPASVTIFISPEKDSYDQLFLAPLHFNYSFTWMRLKRSSCFGASIIIFEQRNPPKNFMPKQEIACKYTGGKLINSTRNSLHLSLLVLNNSFSN